MSLYAVIEQCAVCKRPTDSTLASTLHETTGWIKRRPRSTRERVSGGVNALKFREETGRIMCGQCAQRREDTGNAMQGAML